MPSEDELQVGDKVMFTEKLNDIPRNTRTNSGNMKIVDYIDENINKVFTISKIETGNYKYFLDDKEISDFGFMDIELMKV